MSESIKLPQTAENVYNAYGISWNSIDNIKAADNTYTYANSNTFSLDPGAGSYQAYLYLMVDVDNAVQGGTLWPNQSPLPSSPEVNTSNANATVLSNLTPAIINASSFGALISFYDDMNMEETDYIYASNFGFAIPTGATIDDVEVETKYYFVNNGDSVTDYVDYIRITVTYTSGGTAASQSSFLYLMV